jgi:hypothetical protein
MSINAQAVGVESAYGRPIMSSFQAAWSVGGLVGAALAGAALRSGLVAEENLAAAGAFILAIAFLSVPYLIRERAAGQTSSLAWPDKALLSVAAFTFLPVCHGSLTEECCGLLLVFRYQQLHLAMRPTLWRWLEGDFSASGFEVAHES